MNYQNESKELIEAFKEEVKKKVPIWLKTQVTELKDFLDELEDHIWDKATEYANGRDPEITHVREAIISMGSPRKITKEFKTRGNPKFFITEELWPSYYKSLIFGAVIVLFINMLTMGFDLAKPGANIGATIGQAFEGTFAGFAYVFVGMTLMFVQLSYHGYLPEDFRKMAEAREKKELLKKEARRVGKTVRPERTKKPKREKSVIPSSGSYLFEGIMAFVGGGVLVFYPFIEINRVYIEYWMPALPGWLKLVGGVMLISGIIRFSQALIGKNRRLQQFFLALGIIPMCLSLALWLQVHFNPDLVTNVLSSRFPATNIPQIILAIVVVFSILQILGMIDEIRKIVKLEIKGFEKKESKYEKLMNNH